eukprot:2932310-Prymnesium_polylepis.2
MHPIAKSLGLQNVRAHAPLLSLRCLEPYLCSHLFRGRRGRRLRGNKCALRVAGGRGGACSRDAPFEDGRPLLRLRAARRLFGRHIEPRGRELVAQVLHHLGHWQLSWRLRLARGLAETGRGFGELEALERDHLLEHLRIVGRCGASPAAAELIAVVPSELADAAHAALGERAVVLVAAEPLPVGVAMPHPHLVLAVVGSPVAVREAALPTRLVGQPHAVEGRAVAEGHRASAVAQPIQPLALVEHTLVVREAALPRAHPALVLAHVRARPVHVLALAVVQ